MSFLDDVIVCCPLCCFVFPICGCVLIVSSAVDPGARNHEVALYAMCWWRQSEALAGPFGQRGSRVIRRSLVHSGGAFVGDGAKGRVCETRPSWCFKRRPKGKPPFCLWGLECQTGTARKGLSWNSFPQSQDEIEQLSEGVKSRGPLRGEWRRFMDPRQVDVNHVVGARGLSAGGPGTRGELC